MNSTAVFLFGRCRRLRDSHVGEQREHFRPDISFRQVRVDGEHLRDLVADGAQRIERRHRFLKNH
jgi:hypothetical protein